MQHRSILSVADNSGAVRLMLIGIPGAGRRKIARLGDVVTAVVKRAQPAGTVKKSQIIRAVIVRTRRLTRRTDGSYIKFSDNAAVLVDAAKNPVGTRILGPVAAEVRKAGFSKIISQASEVF